MKTYEIFDEYYSADKVYLHTRYAARAVIMQDGQLFIERAQTPQVIMLPGGGKEDDEDNFECVTRECAEECGIIVSPVEELFKIKEYYRDTVYDTVYVRCEIVGKCATDFTENEKSMSLASGWQNFDAILEDFDRIMALYQDGEELYCCHKRELLAIKHILNIVQHADNQAKHNKPMA